MPVAGIEREKVLETINKAVRTRPEVPDHFIKLQVVENVKRS
jgi:hypothetical protein